MPTGQIYKYTYNKLFKQAIQYYHALPQESFKNHGVYLIGREQLRTRLIMDTESDETIKNIDDIRMQISFLINSPGGPLKDSEYLLSNIQTAQRNGDKVIAFAHPQAMSSAATLLMAADESYVTDSTHILFHASYLPEALYKPGSYFWKKTVLQGQIIYTTGVGDQLLEIRSQLRLSKTVKTKQYEPYIERALEENPEYPEIRFTGREASEIGLVTHSFPDLDDLQQKICETIPASISQRPEVKRFFS